MMMNDILFRIALAIGIASLGLLLFWLLNRLILFRASRASTTTNLQSETWELPGDKNPGTGKPLLLYFTTPDCAPCKTVQRPAIERVWQQMGDCLQVVEVDASTQPEIASRWGVLSVPTIFIIDSDGKPRHVNHGVTTTDKLIKQLETL